MENSSRHIRGVTFAEDASTAHAGTAPKATATLRNLAIGVLKTLGADNIAKTTRAIRDEHSPSWASPTIRTPTELDQALMGDSPQTVGSPVSGSGCARWGKHGKEVMNVRSPLRRLALVPEPYFGESLLSWVDALARLNEVSRPMALQMTGMANASWMSDTFGYHVSDAVVRSVRLTTGLTEERVRDMTLAHYAGGALDPLPQPDAEGQDALAGWRYWQWMVLRQRSNACPVCLGENGARWLLKWRLVWSFACVEHRRYLISECRGCDAGLHPPRPGTPQSWICPGPAPGWGRYKPSKPCGRDIRRMPAKPVHDLRLLDCQQRIDRLLEGSEDLTQAQVHELFGALYRSMQGAWDAERPVRLPRTDKAVHQAWDSDHVPDGFRWQPRPLIVTAAMKIATEAGLDSIDNGGTGAAEQVKARPNWGSPRPRRLVPQGEFQLTTNRFGGHCHHDGCGAWVPAGHGARVNDASGGGTHCSRHADQFNVRARPRERSGPITSTDPRLRFLDARLSDEEQPFQKRNDELRAAGDRGPTADPGRLRGHRSTNQRGEGAEVRRTVPAAALRHPPGLSTNVVATSG